MPLLPPCPPRVAIAVCLAPPRGPVPDYPISKSRRAATAVKREAGKAGRAGRLEQEPVRSLNVKSPRSPPPSSPCGGTPGALRCVRTHPQSHAAAPPSRPAWPPGTARGRGQRIAAVFRQPERNMPRGRLMPHVCSRMGAPGRAADTALQRWLACCRGVPKSHMNASVMPAERSERMRV